MSSNDWEIVQEKAFTAWVNGVLDKNGEKITDITQDFSNGIKLVQFLELISNKKLGKKLDNDPKSRIHKIQNVYLAIQFTETLDIKPEGVAAEDIVDCNKKLILGFLWTLYRKYRIAVIKEGDKSSEEGLLLWCKNTTSGYDGVDIKSFKTGFRDGHAFLALAHKYNPSQFDYDTINKESPEVRLEKAFEIAEKTINIPKLLDINEVMKGTTDERSLILYASLYFHAFSAQAQREALEASQRDAATKLGSLESALGSAQHSREELLRQLSTIEKAKGELTEANAGKDKQIAELTEENRKLKEEVSELKDKVQDLERDKNNLSSKLDTVTAKGVELEAKISELDAKLAELQAQSQKQLEEIEASKRGNQDLTQKLTQSSAKGGDLEAKISDLEAKLAELQALSQKQQEEIETGKRGNQELTEKVSKVEGEKTALNATLAQAVGRLDETTKRADAEFSALLLLRQQFDQHVLDMHRWRKLLEVDNISDFLLEVKAPLIEDLAKDGNFDSQVKLLRGKLEVETDDIQKYLHEKEEFNKQKMKPQK